MARTYAKRLHADLAIVNKRRISGSETTIEHVIGEVEGRDCVIVDDMISTGGSITQAAAVLKSKGAASIVIAVSHAVFCGPAVDRLDAAPVDAILVTDSIPQGERRPKKLKVCSIAPLVAQTIRAINHSESVSSLFE